MALTAMSVPQLSMFTFESTAHSSHVLCCLDEQRRRDMLCDVTVVVEGQSFRAHRSVLASCSEYFTHRMSSQTQRGETVTLPQEVTAAGFEPLLKFAYTSKLLFGRDNVLQIRNSSSILGFRDLDEACFDFLLPKLSSTSKGPASFPRKTCLQKKCKRRLSVEDCAISSGNGLLDDEEVKPVADSPSQQEVASTCNRLVNNEMGSQNNQGTSTLVAEGTNDYFTQCPKYRKFQLACGKETCAAEKSLNNPVLVIKDDPSGSPCSSSANSANEVEFPGKSKANEPWKIVTHDTKTEGHRDSGGVTVKKNSCEREEKENEKERELDTLKMEEKTGHASVEASSCNVLGERSQGLILHHCPAISVSLGQARSVRDSAEDKKTSNASVLQPACIHPKAEELIKPERERADDEIYAAWQEQTQTGNSDREDLPVNNDSDRGTVEWDVAGQPGSDMCASEQDFQDNDAGSSTDTVSRKVQRPSYDWLQDNSRSSSCPFLLQDLDPSKCLWKGNALSECEEASQSGVSSVNSGEDEDSETEGESESYTRERARQVQLPFSVDWIVDLSRNDFQQLLKQQVLTHEQLEFVHDMRRRSKNRLAAQRCRKRKLDCIYNLQCEIDKLKTEREKLITEKSQLNQLKLKTCHSVSALCQRVCSEANLQPEQLQVLAKYTSADCPLSSYCPHTDPFLSHPGLPPHHRATFPACPSGLDKYTAPEEASSSSSRDTVTGDCQHSGAEKDTCGNFEQN